MPTVTVRNLDDDTKRGLQQLGALHGRSMEAEIRAILAAAVRTTTPEDLRASSAADIDRPGLAERIHQRFVDLHLDGELVIELPERTTTVRPNPFEDAASADADDQTPR
ncbi:MULTISPECIES: plasmid stabilization protein [Plantibacter]|uniref:FitA-like ribbon-helix-helix domain-containing protein n=1 Tax=Plantibacter TaxID=190323 RepID=UPI0015829781|nr:plasmid stabilization protein [Plantibacter sp. MCCC 1A11337]